MSTERIPCPKCNANNFASSTTCWQCGEPLRAQPPIAQGSQYPQRPDNYQQTHRPQQRDNTQTLVILGFVFAALGLGCCPLFAIGGMIMGGMVRARGNPLGTWIIAASVLVFAVASILAAVGIGALLRNPETWMPQQGTPPMNIP